MKPNLKLRAAVFGLVLAASAASTVAMAQNDPGHPRENEVNQRLENQQNRIQKGEAQGTISGRQAAADEKRDANIARQESNDEAKHDGHITKKEQNTLNKEENNNSAVIHQERH